MVQRKQSGLTLSERRLVKRLVIFLAVVVVLWIVFAPGWGILHYKQVHDRLESLSLENKSLATRNEELRKEIDRLQKNDAYLEELARKKYGMLKENETVYEYGSSGKKK